MIPGSNLLDMALSIIASQAIVYYRATGRATNNIGQEVTSYADPILIYGSFQPVPKSLYLTYSLDFQKSYFTFYTSNNIIDVQRDAPPDQIVFNSQRFACESNNDWFAVDGWKGVLCVLQPRNDDDQLIFGFNQKPSINGNFGFNQGGFKNEG